MCASAPTKLHFRCHRPSRTQGGSAWWPLIAVDLQGDTILGKVRGILGPSRAVKIDRQSGEIELTFIGTTFSGACEKVVEEPGVRQF